MNDETEPPSESRLASAVNPSSTLGSILLPLLILILASGWWLDHRRLARQAAARADEAQQARLSLLLLQAEREKWKGGPTAIPAMPPEATPAPARQLFEGMDFVPPAGWSRELVDAGLLFVAPEIEGNWQGNLFLEVREDSEGRSLEQSLADIVPNLRTAKQHFQEVSRQIESRPSGLRLGRIEYTCTYEGIGLTQWEVLVELDGKKRLFVLASSTTAHWDKYLPVFQSLIGSLRVNRDEA